jgi:diguanylate cyclase (GGDEF)-like protein/PAS domain S-box-containing protein
MQESNSTGAVDERDLTALAFRHTPTPTLVIEVGRDGDNKRVAGDIRAVSESFLQLLGASEDGVIGHSLQDFVHPDDERVFGAGLEQLLDPIRRAQIRIVRPGWGVVWVAVAAAHIAASPEDLEAVTLLILTLDDITAFRKAEQALAHRASHDPLTGLPNRAVLMSHLGRVLARLGRQAGTVAVMFVDLDGFKNINDTFGHRVGDAVLKEVARRISVAVRRDDVVTRMGGDEFVVVCDALESTSESAMVAERIRAALDEPFESHGRSHQVSASIGVAQTSDSATPGEDLLRRSDLAMYLAKERGRNRVEFFAAELEDRVRDRMRMVDLARRALADDALRISVQPVFSLRDHTVTGYEAFARIQTPRGQLLAPQHFLPAAEKSGLITRVDSRVIDLGLQWMRDKQANHSGCWLAINVSVRLIANARFGQTLLSQVLDMGLQPADVVIEIGESRLMGANGPAFTTLRKLRAAGFRIALDDFGTGASSLTAMRDLPVDLIKIDQSFVAGLGTDPADESIVAAIISVSHDLGLTVIAEGVERPLQADYLRAQGCDLAQGYLFGSPVRVSS